MRNAECGMRNCGGEFETREMQFRIPNSTFRN